jgi:hypothetical protein
MESAVLDILSGEMTALQVAERLGHPTPREVVPTLNSLHGDGRVSKRVDAGHDGEGPPIVRWRSA